MIRAERYRLPAVLDDIAGFARTARRVVSRGRERFFDPDDDDQRRIARSIAIDLSTAADHLPDEFTAAHPEINWRGIRGLRNVAAHDYKGMDHEILWEMLATRLPEVVKHLGLE